MSHAPAFNRVFWWLVASATMVWLMAIIGAITRLTESGLSITEWAPITGAIPPLTEADWLAAKEAYRQTPQYQLLMQGMSMEDFKFIYFWEWVHRLWGRLIGLVYALPLFYFTATRQLPPQLLVRCWVLLGLGGLQGFVGWFMVQSGLIDQPTVSHYRLAMHLGLATFIFALLVWTARDVKRLQANQPLARFWASPPLGLVALAVLAITIVWGAFVAGLDAGFAYNTWPDMDGQMISAAAFTLSPTWLNALENAALVQFIHRWLGIAAALLILAYAWQCWKNAPIGQRTLPFNLGVAALLQPTLGILTLLTHVQITIATLHQAVALILLALLLLNLAQPYKASQT